MNRVSRLNTLEFDAAACTGCGYCADVCPHGVFTLVDHKAQIVRGDACMECGACQRNCGFGAVRVDSGVGCAAAMIRAALQGRPMDAATCG